MSMNPFPGPEPYRAEDRARFFGRAEISRKLAESLLGSRCITLYGPSGSGKTSLLQASVLPALVESQDVRVVYVAGWPPGEDARSRLVNAMVRDLRLGAPPTEDLPPTEAVIEAAKRAARASSRLMIVCLDQMDQLFYADRPVLPIEAFLACIEDLLGMPLRPVRIVLVLREDYLGRFLERLQGRLRMLEHYFRLRPLTVSEVIPLVCRTAAAGEPPQEWSPVKLKPLINDLRVHDQVESDQTNVRLTNVQRFCHALFERRMVRPVVERSIVEEEGAIRRELGPYVEKTILDATMIAEPARRDAEDPEEPR